MKLSDVILPDGTDLGHAFGQVATAAAIAGWGDPQAVMAVLRPLGWNAAVSVAALDDVDRDRDGNPTLLRAVCGAAGRRLHVTSWPTYVTCPDCKDRR